MVNSHLLLVTAIGFGESSDSEITPWSIYLTRNGKTVMNGGSYPDENPDAKLLIDNLDMVNAIAIAKRLQSLMLELGVPCEIEELGDG